MCVRKGTIDREFAFAPITIDGIGFFLFYRLIDKMAAGGPLAYLSPIAKAVFALILDRYDLSVKNNWKDGEKGYFCTLDQEKAAEHLSCDRGTIRKALEELGPKGAGIIHCERAGQQYHNRIFLTNRSLASLDEEKFTRIPQVLFTTEPFRSGLSLGAKLVYSRMLNRVSLSILSGRVDASGYVYITYTVKDVIKDIGYSTSTAKKILNELDQNGIGLIRREPQGIGKPARVYVNNFMKMSPLEIVSDASDSYDLDDPYYEPQCAPSAGLNSQHLRVLNSTIRGLKFQHQEGSNFTTNILNKKHIEIYSFCGLDKSCATVNCNVTGELTACARACARDVDGQTFDHPENFPPAKNAGCQDSGASTDSLDACQGSRRLPGNAQTPSSAPCQPVNPCTQPSDTQSFSNSFGFADEDQNTKCHEMPEDSLCGTLGANRYPDMDKGLECAVRSSEGRHGHAGEPDFDSECPVVPAKWVETPYVDPTIDMPDEWWFEEQREYERLLQADMEAVEKRKAELKAQEEYEQALDEGRINDSEMSFYWDRQYDKYIADLKAQGFDIEPRRNEYAQDDDLDIPVWLMREFSETAAWNADAWEAFSESQDMGKAGMFEDPSDDVDYWYQEYADSIMDEFGIDIDAIEPVMPDRAWFEEQRLEQAFANGDVPSEEEILSVFGDRYLSDDDRRRQTDDAEMASLPIEEPMEMMENEDSFASLVEADCPYKEFSADQRRDAAIEAALDAEPKDEFFEAEPVKAAGAEPVEAEYEDDEYEEAMSADAQDAGPAGAEPLSENELREIIPEFWAPGFITGSYTEREHRQKPNDPIIEKMFQLEIDPYFKNLETSAFDEWVPPAEDSRPDDFYAQQEQQEADLYGGVPDIFSAEDAPVMLSADAFNPSDEDCPLDAQYGEGDCSSSAMPSGNTGNAAPFEDDHPDEYYSADQRRALSVEAALDAEPVEVEAEAQEAPEQEEPAAEWFERLRETEAQRAADEIPADYVDCAYTEEDFARLEQAYAEYADSMLELGIDLMEGLSPYGIAGCGPANDLRNPETLDALDSANPYSDTAASLDMPDTPDDSAATPRHYQAHRLRGPRTRRRVPAASLPSRGRTPPLGYTPEDPVPPEAVVQGVSPHGVCPARPIHSPSGPPGFHVRGPTYRLPQRVRGPCGGRQGSSPPMLFVRGPCRISLFQDSDP